MILHVRDPRQAMISWMYYLINRGKKFQNGIHPDQKLTLMYYKYPRNLTDLTIEEQIDWHIKNYYTENIKWIKSWVDFEKNFIIDLNSQKIKFNLNILFTTYETFVKNPIDFIYKILKFYNTENIEIKRKLVYRDENKIPNFRKGEVDEWKKILTSNQIQKVNSLLDKDLINKFNWSF